MRLRKAVAWMVGSVLATVGAWLLLVAAQIVKDDEVLYER